MKYPVRRSQKSIDLVDRMLRIHAPTVADFLVEFLRDECIRQRRTEKVVLGLSGGVDSAVVAYLAARAFWPENVLAIRLPYRMSSQASLDHARLVVEDLGITEATIDISAMVDGYVCQEDPEMSSHRVGNICARCRLNILFDQSAKIGGLPLGTGNKTERFFGYFTWHADDAPPINAIGDLFKTQVWQLAKHLGVPDKIVSKAPTADLVSGQTDEGDFGISYRLADQILVLMADGWTWQQIVDFGFDQDDVSIVQKRVSGTHWKRKLPTVALISDTAINEYYLRPVDY